MALRHRPFDTTKPKFHCSYYVCLGGGAADAVFICKIIIISKIKQYPNYEILKQCERKRERERET